MLLRSGRRYHPYRRPFARSTTPRRKVSRAPRRRRSTKATTSKYGKASSTNFRSKKTTLRQYRNHLWRSTSFSTHYRSIGQSFSAPAEPVSGFAGAAILYLLPALSPQGTNQHHITPSATFWTTPNAQPADTGGAVPTFSGDFTIRGGFCRLMLHNRDETQLRFKVWGVWAEKNPSGVVYTALHGSARGAEFDPSAVADFDDFGKVLFQREATVDFGQSMDVIHRLKVQKVDRISHLGTALPIRPAGSQLWWMVLMVVNNANVAATGINFVSSWNLSFSADAV